MQEVTQRILDTVGGIAGSSLEQTSWLSRSLEVKVQPQVCPEADEAEDAEADGDHEGRFTCLDKPLPLSAIPNHWWRN